MHLTKYRDDGRISVGLLEGDEVVDLSDQHASIREAVAACALGRTPRTAGAKRHALGNVSLAPIVDEPTLVVAVALNYAGHVSETKNRPPASPITFFKPFTSLIGGGESIVKPRVTERLDYEGEIAIVIGREVYDANEKEAYEAIWGVTAVNDVSGRDLLKSRNNDDPQFRDWVSCKALEQSSPIGPCIVPLDEVRDDFNSGSLRVETFLNSDRVQVGQLSQLLVPCTALVRFVSSRFRLKPGDIICTGTPEGVGNVTGRLLQDGDHISVKVGGVPLLANTVSFAPRPRSAGSAN